ncbi:alginate lyase family protein [Pedobacter sp. ISL-68]|uniref:alginate lyase family protein n=1 Tax=unclassified Pedobacter TaxID=2628915 RepID=UPI001BE4F337|nr:MULTISPECIES: alginate lyase family protein [unclassified Pedobacter]MBT2561005.1 alginate lyase family protein [Pedobacter sp. ISL-64]MBT2590394.1 alginate lyase family protein [Pedobacter sp. ISL-68]
MKKIQCLYLIVYFLFFLSSISSAQQKFVHPGILFSGSDLQRIYQAAQDKSSVGYTSFELLRNNPLASADYKMKGPFRVISRDGEFGNTKSLMEADFSSAYLNSLMWVATRDQKHAEKAITILLGYADSLQRIPATNDAPLLVGLEGTKIINALEILKHDFKRADPRTLERIARMVTGIFLTVCEQFYASPAYTNGNWGPIVTKFYLSAAIYLDDQKMYDKAVRFYLHANDNGTIVNYVDAETGQIQESGRDQGHSQLGIGAMATICEIAWKQGDNLYGALDNRLLKGFEYTASYNLGNEVPFKKWKDITGKYSDWEQISVMGRGRFIPIYQMVYNHYVRRKGLSMPFTQQLIAKMGAEGYDRDQPGFGGLLYLGSK